MLYQVTGVCQHCASEYSVTVHNDNALSGCTECAEPPFELKRYKGLVYVVSNENQSGVKIGMTQRSIESRLKSLSNTSVPGKFACIAIFPSDRPKKDESKVHEKLARHRLDKEHFNISPIDAALGCYRALNRRRPIFYCREIEEMFDLRLEEARVKMQIKLKGKTLF